MAKAELPHAIACSMSSRVHAPVAVLLQNDESRYHFVLRIVNADSVSKLIMQIHIRFANSKNWRNFAS